MVFMDLLALPAPALILVLSELDTITTLSLRLASKRHLYIGRSLVTEPLSPAQHLPTELVHQILLLCCPIAFDAARLTCSKWYHTSFSPALLKRQISNHLCERTFKRLTEWERDYIAYGREIANQQKKLREANWAVPPAERVELLGLPKDGIYTIVEGDVAWKKWCRIQNVLSRGCKRLTPTWRCKVCGERDVVQFSKDMDLRWVSTTGMWVLGKGRDGKMGVYAMYDPAVYLDNSTEDMDTTVGKLKTRIRLKSDEEAKKAWYRTPPARKQHDQTPTRLIEISLAEGLELVDALFLNSSNGAFTAQVQLVVLGKSEESYRLIVYNIGTKQRLGRSNFTWKVSQLLEFTLDYSAKVELFTISPQVDILQVKGKDGGYRQVYITIGGEGALETVVLQYEEAELPENPILDVNGEILPATYFRNLFGFKSLGTMNYRSDHPLNTASWIIKDTILPFHNNDFACPLPSEQPRAVLYISYALLLKKPIRKGNAGLGMGFTTDKCYQLATLATSDESSLGNPIPDFWTMRFAKSDTLDYAVPRTLVSLLRPQDASGELALTKDLGYMGALGVASWNTITPIPDGSGKLEITQEIHLASFKLGPLSTSTSFATATSLDNLLVHQMCQLNVQTSARAVTFDCIAVKNLGCYTAGILQPGNQVWVWVTPHVFDGPHPKSPGRMDKPTSRLAGSTNGLGFDANLWPEVHGTDTVVSGRKVGMVYGVETVRWDWRPPRSSGKVWDRVRYNDMVLNLVVTTSAGRIFMLNFLEKGASWVEGFESRHLTTKVGANQRWKMKPDMVFEKVVVKQEKFKNVPKKEKVAEVDVESMKTDEETLKEVSKEGMSKKDKIKKGKSILVRQEGVHI